jgi:hypothetical protein
MDEDDDYGLRVEDIRRKVMLAFCPERNKARARIRAEVDEKRTGEGRGVRGGRGCGRSGRGRGHDGRGRGGDGIEAGEAGADRNNVRKTLLHPIDVQEMVDGHVDDAVYDKYLNEVMVFGDWRLGP